MDLSRGTNRQKSYVKLICRVLYYLGIGSYWCEDHAKIPQLTYRIWMAISNGYTFAFLVNQHLAYFRSDLNDKEKNDLYQFTLAHTTISGKIIVTYLQRKQISEVLPRLLERSSFVSQELDDACFKRSVRLCIAAVAVSYMAILSSTVDGFKTYLAEGTPMRTEVTFYPPSSASGLAVNVLRFFVQLHWWFIVTVMVSIDCLCISSLVTVGYKFKLLQVYFNSMRQKILENAGSQSRPELGDEFRKDFVVGIKMHDDALWCAKNVQSALGILYSVQIFESVILLVMCLIKLVAVERNLIFLLANFLYICCLILLTGAYMMPAGDITHEASLVPTSMFHSGWELVSTRDLRVLMVLALQRSQVPVCMSAFGVLTLSYGSFITVIRSSYSFFAVMY